MPPSSSPAPAPQPSTGLQTLVHNLRTRQSTLEPEFAGSSSWDFADEGALIRELQARVEHLAETHALPPHDITLVRTLVSLVKHFYRLSVLQPSTGTSTAPRVASWGSSAPGNTSDRFAALRRQLSDFQLAREDLELTSASSATSPALQVETALLWVQVDEELEQVLTLCRSRTYEGSAAPDADLLPPEYDTAWYDAQFESEGLPRYEPGSSAHALEKLGSPTLSAKGGDLSSPVERAAPGGALSEKMRMDLEAVTLAIDRLYIVAPQLHDQRVELKKSKLEELEKARLSGSPSRSKVREGKRRAKDDDVEELERMVELIGRATDRRMLDQSVSLDGVLKAKLERARQRDVEKREAFVERLARHSDARRLHAQDAILTPPGSARDKGKDPDAMLSLPEFIREAVPEPVQLKMQMEDPKALLSLPEFVKEPVPKGLAPSPRRARSGSALSLRSRSISAPPLAWLLSRPSSPIPASPTEARKMRSSKTRRMGSSVASIPALQASLDVTYVAEFHESLQHVLVFLTATGMTPGVNLEAEVVPASEVPGKTSDDRECLVVKCGTSTSPFLQLPARVAPGKKEVKVDGQHFQIKLATIPASDAQQPAFALVDATYLNTALPTSYICASCSLPLVHCSRLQDYRDLPSEHWAELVDAWMCHSDLKLHEHVTKHTSEGFWPTETHALVGGSYILFEQSAMARNNFGVADEDKLSEDEHPDDWQRVRCICGAIVGRRREHQPKEGPRYWAYRLAKYAIRPVSPTAEPCRIPLSAFIAEDMNEFVHAHATYRFIIMDEEDERPRILIWLFKPSMRIAYTTPTQYVIPKSGSVHAAKVLYKIIGPPAAYSDLQSISSKYPGFPQAEHLYYPLDICRRLAGLLKESNTAYPEGMRTMTGLDVGWLQRS
ncbi:hypothetical protein WOLCODRAFT_106948 [Wolfiporia cocos MD-104 SS10]|uniref:HECT-like ubiquitin-conjugating enzyme-binding-domain-containing protein n=1 Tax=Wolfiporia cocos (strain MD-104) TaxID=742152 RepID=A0A2H3IZE1_WOLCO|nr:hypothetical protein WOLCODRAFT_106948 [Wolfiporia cocos MD-104 SS10]